MAIVVMDTSAIIAGLVAIPGEKDVRAAIRKATKDADLYAPASVRWELANAIRKMVFRERLTKEDGTALLENALNMRINYVEIDPVRAFKLAMRLKTAAYDAYVLECAREVGAPLLTVEREDRMPAKARQLKIEVIEVSHHVEG